jgi:hypothetical protein
MFAALRWPASSTYIQENNEMNITESLEQLLKAEVAARVEAVKQAADESINAIRQAAGRVIAELEAHAERLASGQAAVAPVHSTATPVPPQAPSMATPQVHLTATAVPSPATQALNTTDPDRDDWVPPTPGSGLVEGRVVPYRS